LARGLVCGAMTGPGGLEHILPFLELSFTVALTTTPAVVLAEHAAI
jgi:hypothetical protein